MTWKPAPRTDVDVLKLPLDAEQGFLFSQLDGATDLDTLAVLTGLPAPKVERMLAELVGLGAVAPGGPAVPASAPAARPHEEVEPSAEPVEEAADEEEDKASATLAATHRKLFEEALHGRSTDERVALARLAEEPELSAYCFDPMAQVIQAVLENARASFLQARLIATHHRTSAGIEALAARTHFAADAGVRRALLKNPLLPPSIYRRLWSSKRLLEQYLVTASRDTPEQTRSTAREVLRASFSQRTGEERVELILVTEGRCLTSLAGLTIDGHTTALLCRRSYVSSILIQNFARWSAAPPQLIAHLRRQDLVRRNPQLKMLLERHPNAS
jgi:hypothetical protein